jgi:hypothetical protein
MLCSLHVNTLDDLPTGGRIVSSNCPRIAALEVSLGQHNAS